MANLAQPQDDLKPLTVRIPELVLQGLKVQAIRSGQMVQQWVAGSIVERLDRERPNWREEEAADPIGAER